MQVPNPVNGTVGLDKTGNNKLGSNPDYYNGGVTAHIDLTCSAASILTVADPLKTSGPTTTTGAAIVYTSAGNLSSPSGSGSKTVALPAGFAQTSMNVDVDNSAPTPILGGTYSYKVVLTATPN